MPTWGEFLAIAQIQGLEPRTAKSKIAQAARESPPIRYFRKEDGSIFICAAFKLEDRLTPEYLSCLCRSLGVDP